MNVREQIIALASCAPSAFDRSCLEPIAAELHEHNANIARARADPAFASHIRHPDIAIAAATAHGSAALALLPEHLKSSPVFFAAVTHDPQALSQCPNPSAALCLAAVSAHGLALAHVPHTLKTPEVCAAAIAANPAAFPFSPHQSPKLCIAAIRHDPKQIRHVIPEVLDAYPFLALMAVALAPITLCHIPPAIQAAHPEIAVTAVSRSGYTIIKHANPQHAAAQIVAVSRDPRAARHIPNLDAQARALLPK